MINSIPDLEASRQRDEEMYHTITRARIMKRYFRGGENRGVGVEWFSYYLRSNPDYLDTIWERCTQGFSVPVDESPMPFRRDLDKFDHENHDCVFPQFKIAADRCVDDICSLQMLIGGALAIDALNEEEAADLEFMIMDSVGAHAIHLQCLDQVPHPDDEIDFEDLCRRIDFEKLDKRLRIGYQLPILSRAQTQGSEFWRVLEWAGQQERAILTQEYVDSYTQQYAQYAEA